MTINKGKVVDTRIALRIDSEANWQKNNPVLMVGEIAMSYGGAEWDRENKTYKYTEFKFKVGARNTKTGTLLQWNDLKPINFASLDQESIDLICDQVEERMKGIFLFRDEFEKFKEKIRNQVVTGWNVDDSSEELYLTRELQDFNFNIEGNNIS